MYPAGSDCTLCVGVSCWRCGVKTAASAARCSSCRRSECRRCASTRAVWASTFICAGYRGSSIEKPKPPRRRHTRLGVQRSRVRKWLDKAAAFQDAEYAEGSLRKYKNLWNRIQLWGGKHGIETALPLSPDALSCWLVYRSTGDNAVLPATLEKDLCAVAYFHKQHGFDDPTKSLQVKSVMKGIKRKRNRPAKRKKRIHIDWLFELIEAYGAQGGIRPSHAVRHRTTRSPAALEKQALCIALFYGMLRRAETLPIRTKDVAVKALRNGTKFTKITVRKAKNLKSGARRYIYIPQNLSVRRQSIDTSQLMSEVLKLRKTKNEKLFFGHRDNKDWSRFTDEFCTLLRLDRKRYGTHSFRRGGATQIYRSTSDEAVVAELGGWALSDKGKKQAVRQYFSTSVLRRLHILQRM